MSKGEPGPRAGRMEQLQCVAPWWQGTEGCRWDAGGVQEGCRWAALSSRNLLDLKIQNGTVCASNRYPGCVSAVDIPLPAFPVAEDLIKMQVSTPSSILFSPSNRS